MKALVQEGDSQGLRMTPLIDIVFNLIIFFLVATTLYDVEKDITIKLAEATQGGERKSSAQILIVNIRESGVVVVDERVRTFDELSDLLRKAKQNEPSIAVVLRCDRNTYHKFFVQALDVCEKAGVGSVAVAILESAL